MLVGGGDVESRGGIAFRALAGVGLAGCVVHTPPARGLPLETSEPVGAGRTAAQVEATRALGLASSGALRMRHGVGRDTDVSLETTVIHIPPYWATSDAGSPRDEKLDTWGLRAGVKERLSRVFAVSAGVGAGLFAGGPFVAPDVALIASWNNGVVEPFVAVRISVSVPFASRKVIEDGRALDPQRAWYIGPSAGVRIPFGRVAVLGGATWTWYGPRDLAPDDTWLSYLALGVGAELTF